MIDRRDSFITHRAFCDALTEENNNNNNNKGLLVPLPLQIPIPTENANNNTNKKQHHHATLMAEFSPDLKNHLMSMPLIKPLTMAAAGPSSMIFSPHTDSSPPSSASLQLGGSHSSAHMSATVLLQKAAQMGAMAASENIIRSPPPHMLQNRSSSGMGMAGMAGLDMRNLGVFHDQTNMKAGGEGGHRQLFYGGNINYKMGQREWEMMTVDYMGVDRGRSSTTTSSSVHGFGHAFQCPVMGMHGHGHGHGHGQTGILEKTMEDV